VFEFDYLCSTFECLITSAIEYDSYPTSLELEPLSDSTKYSFLGLNTSLLVIIDSNLDED